MNEYQAIVRTVTEVAERRRRQRGIQACCQVLFISSAVFLLVLSCYKFLPFPGWSLALVGTIALIAPGVAFAAAYRHKPSLLESARWLDATNQFQDRLATALELARPDQSNEWRHLVTRDAAQCAYSVNSATQAPYRLSRFAAGSMPILSLCALLIFVPEHRSQAYQRSQRDKENIRESGRRLLELTKRRQELAPAAMPTTQKVMDAISLLGSNLMQNPAGKTEALKDISSLADKVEKQLADLGKSEAIQKLDRAAAEQTATGEPSRHELEKKIEALEEMLGQAANKNEQLDKMRADLDKAQKTGSAMADGSSGMDEAARQKLAESLAQLNQQAQSMGQKLEGLDEAIKALEAGNTDLFLKDLNLAIKDLDKLRDLANALKEAQQSLASKSGKDLGEQLELCQAELAVQTLKKMIEQLQSKTPSDASLTKMMNELQKAIKPAENYGDVGKSLADALRLMKSANPTEAAVNLTAAKNELEQLIQQMGDAQSLMASLEALQRASMSISQCQGWGNTVMPGMIRFGKGGKPSRGVGTWAENEGWMSQLGNRDQVWDNSGGVMPTLDSKGITERPESVPDNLEATKLKGKFSKGNSMPAITLKGVSIKGTSSVGFEEAATAAQSDAQNALNQDLVPRAYRNNVKNYFDDLKK